MTPLATWILAAMLSLVPHGVRRDLPGWSETPDQMRLRYTSIAQAIEAAALASSTGYSDKSEAALLVALAMEESAFAQDVDVGPCYRGTRGGPWWTRCDGGRSFSVWQVKPYTKADGVRVSGAELQADRVLAAKRALSLAVSSLGQCAKRVIEPRDRLSAYIRGTCAPDHAGSRKRYDLWRRIEVWQPKGGTP